MKKVIRLTENDLIRIVERVINEDGGGIPKNHPVNNPLYIKMKEDIEGEGVETIEFVPNQKLVIDAFGNKYTITKGKF